MDNKINTYDIELRIDVANQYLYSNIKINYCSSINTNELRFYIYKNIEFDDIICDREISYEIGKEIIEWSPFVLESKLIKISFSEPIQEGEEINLNFKYKGYIDIVTQYGVNRLTKDWIELGIYTPWFPLSEKLEQAAFNVRIKIDDSYKLINSNKIGDYSVINQSEPNVDCSIIASNCFDCVSGSLGNIKVNVYFTEGRYKDYAQQISNYSIRILDRYIQFGDIYEKELSIVIAPREDGGGYCRPSLIVLTPNDDLEDEVEYFKFIAHEIAHLWWCKSKNPDTWEDWLNESFAEFSALLALRDVFGDKEFNNKINAYVEKTKGLPPIKGLDRRHNMARSILYMKGPLLLSQLEKNIGKDKFAKFLNRIHLNKVDTTERLLKELCEITSEDVKENFNEMLLQ